MKKILKISGISIAILLVAIVLIYKHVPAKTTEAAASPAPTISDITVFNSTNYATISLDSPGPYSQDFRYTVCWEPEPNLNNPWQTTCVTSPWASDAGTAGAWSQWIWPGHSDEMGSGSHLYVSNVETRALPAGQFLNNVQLGIELSEDNSGNLVGTNIDLGCESWVSQYTPVAGGTSGQAYAHLYGCGGTSDTPDTLRVYISTGIVGASLSGDFPSQMTPGETVNTSTITVYNSGSVILTPTTWTVTPIGPGTGVCPPTTPDPNFDPSSGAAPDGQTCTTPVNLTANDLLVTHSGTFITPQTIPFSMQNVTQTQTYYPRYTANFGPGCLDDALNGNSGSVSLFGFSFNLPFVKTANAAMLGGCQIRVFPAKTITTYVYNGQYFTLGSLGISSGQTGVFQIMPLTAPNATGTYTETWTLSNSQGDVPGGTLTKSFDVESDIVPPPVASSTGSVNVMSVNSANGSPVVSSWQVSASSLPNSLVCGLVGDCFGQKQTYQNLPLANTLSPFGDVVTVQADTKSAGKLYALKGVEQTPSIAIKKKDDFLQSAFTFSKSLFVGVANAETYCSYLGTPSNSCPSNGYIANPPVINLTQPGDTGNFIILWDPEADMDVESSSVALSSGNLTSQISVSNTGAPGSELGWTSTVNYTNGSNWLTVSPASDSTGVSVGSPETVTLTANAGSLASGTYNATIKFIGNTLNSSNQNLISPKFVNVVLTVSGCTSNCVPAPTVTIAPTSNTINLGNSQIFTVNSSNATTCTGTGDLSGTQTCNGTVTVTPSNAGTFSYGITASNGNGNDANANSTITVQSGGGGGGGGGSHPAVTITPTNTSITLGSSEKLNITSSGATTCTGTGSWSGSEPCSGQISVSPSSAGTFSYGIDAVNSSGEVAHAVANVVVTDLSNPGSYPTCSQFTANPSSVVVPQTSKLSYNCANVNTCTLSGGQFGSTGVSLPVSGTTATGQQTVAPTANTFYSLTCQGSQSGVNYSTNVQLQIIATSPKIIETNP